MSEGRFRDVLGEAGPLLTRIFAGAALAVFVVVLLVVNRRPRVLVTLGAVSLVLLAVVYAVIALVPELSAQPSGYFASVVERLSVWVLGIVVGTALMIVLAPMLVGVAMARAGLLDRGRRRLCPEAGHRPELALELVHALLHGREREAERLVLCLEPARAHADVDAAAGDVVGGQGELGEHGRRAERDRRDERAEPYPLREGGQRVDRAA